MKYIANLAEFEALHASSEGKLVVIDFTATWCPPCRMIGPIFESYVAEFPNAILVKVDVDAASDVAAKCEISAMPTFQFFKNGEKIAEFSGADKDKLKATIQANL